MLAIVYGPVWAEANEEARMDNQMLSLAILADRLGTNPGRLRYHLDKHQVVTNRRILLGKHSVRVFLPEDYEIIEDWWTTEIEGGKHDEMV